MKKVLAAFALMFAISQGMAMDLGFSTNFDSEHVTSGSKGGKRKQETHLDLSGQGFGGHITFGIDTRTMIDRVGTNKVAPRVGYGFNVGENVELSAGYQAYFLGHASSGKSQINEFRLSAATIHAIHPLNFAAVTLSADAFFNVEERDFSACATLRRRVDLAVFGLDRCSLGNFVEIGFDHCARPGGSRDFFETVAQGDAVGHFYYNLGSRFTYAYAPNVSFHAGVRFAGNTASSRNWNNGCGQHNKLLWFSGGIESKF